MNFISQLFASAVGGAIAGYFVVIGVRLQFRRQNEAALRALMVEVIANKEAAAGMNGDLRVKGDYVLGHPDPSWLKHSIWDIQLPFVVQSFDVGTLTAVRYAYSLLDAVPSMVNGRRPSSEPQFNRGGWIDTVLQDIERAFHDADQALTRLSKRLAQDAETAWYNRLKKFLLTLSLTDCTPKRPTK